jgi:hypothetical protein
MSPRRAGAGPTDQKPARTSFTTTENCETSPLEAAFPGSFERLLGTPHGAGLEQLADSFDLPYQRLDQPGDLARAGAPPGPQLGASRPVGPASPIRGPRPGSGRRSHPPRVGQVGYIRPSGIAASAVA